MAELERIITNEQNDSIKESFGVDISKEINNARNVLKLYSDKFGEIDPQKVENIKIEYEEIRLKTIETFKGNIEITRNSLNELLTEIQDVNAIGESYKFRTTDFLENETKINSKGVEYNVRVLKNDIPDDKMDNLKNDLDKFLDSNLSISNLSVSQVAWMLSGIQIAGNEYRELLIDKLSNDTDGLLFIEDNWNVISNKNQIGGSEMIKLTSDILQSAGNAITIEVGYAIRVLNPNLSELDLNNMIGELSDKIEKVRIEGNPKEIFNILGEIMDNPQELLGLASKIIGLNTLKNSVEIAGSEKVIEHFENDGTYEDLGEEGKIIVQNVIKEEVDILEEDNNSGEVLVESSINTSETDSLGLMSASIIQNKIEKNVENIKEKNNEVTVLRKAIDTVSSVITDSGDMVTGLKDKIIDNFNKTIGKVGSTIDNAMEKVIKIAEENGLLQIVNKITNFVKEVLLPNESNSIDKTTLDYVSGDNNTNLDSLKTGETITMNFNGGNTDIIKTDSGFNVKIGNDIEKCANQEEVENVLVVGELMARLGLNFMFGNVHTILQRVYDNTESGIKFNFKDGMDEDEKIAFTGVMCEMLKGGEGNETPFDTFEYKGLDFSNIVTFFKTEALQGEGISKIAETAGIYNKGTLQLLAIDDKLSSLKS